METTLFLAKGMSLLLLAFSLGYFLNPKHYNNLIKEYGKSRSILFLHGYFEVVLGFLLVMSHNNWVKEAIKSYMQKNDILILISSSGSSKNIINAAKYCIKKNIPLITLSGFEDNNPLSTLGNVNIHIKSKNYNYVEMSHHIILLSIVDIFSKNIA